MSVRSVFPRHAVIQSATPADRTSRRSFVGRPRARVRACVRAGVAQCAAGACVLVCGGATQYAASRKNIRPPEKRVGTLNKKRRCARAARPPRVVGAACEVLHKEKGRCVRAVARRGPRAAGAARMAPRAQQHRSCVMIVCTSRLWARARAGALVLAAVRENVRADAVAVADSDVDVPPCTCPSQPDGSGHCRR